MLDQEQEKRVFKTVAITRPVDFNRDDYETLDTIVAKVFEEQMDDTGLSYSVRFRDTHMETVSPLISLPPWVFESALNGTFSCPYKRAITSHSPSSGYPFMSL
jgi:hypothetical protein